VAVAARVAYVLWVLGPVRSGLDAIWYQLQGGSILAGTGYVVPTSLFEGELTPTAAFPPVYPAYQALWQWMFGPGATAVRMAGVVPGSSRWCWSPSWVAHSLTHGLGCSQPERWR
jgi:hypothetical protein